MFNSYLGCVPCVSSNIPLLLRLWCFLGWVACYGDKRVLSLSLVHSKRSLSRSSLPHPSYHSLFILFDLFSAGENFSSCAAFFFFFLMKATYRKVSSKSTLNIRFLCLKAWNVLIQCWELHDDQTRYFQSFCLNLELDFDLSTGAWV